MDREDIVKLAREAGFRDTTTPVIALGVSWEQVQSFAALIAAAEREKLAAWMIQRGFATGHGDTIKDLLKELEWQIEERISNEREACASICFQEGPSIDGELIAEAIRARGEK